MGASLALALKKYKLTKTITGFGRNEKNLKQAKSKGMIDEYRLDIKDACKDADLIVLATPVGYFKPIAKQIVSYLKAPSIVIDIGSVKGQLVYELEGIMPEGIYYIGCHPIAGSEKSGIKEASADLFKQGKCIITPTEISNKNALLKIKKLWQKIRMKVETMTPLKHDKILANTSHFTHILAFTIVNTIDNPDYLKYAGNGFKDTTRIAMSSPEIWADISLFNKENILQCINKFEINLKQIKANILKNNKTKLSEQFLKAQKLRGKIK